VIRISPIPAAPAVLTGPDSAAAKEKKEAWDYWNKNATMKGFTFAVYKKPEVVAALTAVFQGKCAYCEFRYDAGAPPDIEHYRPKGAVVVNGKLEEPGYYWLAAEWTNLLPSCIDCNRKRYHEFADDEPEARGKANQFPIGGNKERAKKPGDEAAEERLLLHPYFDEPREYVIFVEEGAIQALVDDASQPKPMATASIEVYGLDRPKLSLARRDVWVRVAATVKRAKRDSLIATARPGDAEAQLRMEESIADLKRELSARASFLAMARQLAEPVAEVLR
jgi:uncharacterized protein (TIGR02646 family)